MITKQMIAVFSGLCLMASIQAQTNQAQQSTTVAAAVPGGEVPVYSIDFPGGTPEQLVQQMATASGTRPNVIIPSYVADVQLPKFKLQNVNSSQVFNALNTVLNSGSDEKGTQFLRWIADGPHGTPNQVWTLAKAAPRPKPETCQVVYIGHLLSAFQLEDINAAVRTAWDMLGKKADTAFGSGASLKFHKETKILIAKGTEEELKLALDVLKSLEQAAVARKQAEASK